jgi:type III restriction enzyme
MKINYETLEYQSDAVDSVISLFDFGKNIKLANINPLLNVDIIPNDLVIDTKRLKSNLEDIQRQNLGKVAIDELNLSDFSVEMETGTGKTFVYLKTMFELNKKYGLTKFIIVTPSIAVREGVIKTLNTTRDYFYKAYNQHITQFAYDGESKNKITKLKQFSTMPTLSVLVMSIQAFNSDNNIINDSGRDDVGSGKMIDTLAGLKPVVILDEPQNMESDLSKSAINNLNPLFKLRYSATHKKAYNLLYSLSPFAAYNKGLVKKVEIASVDVNDPNAFVFVVEKLNFIKGKSPSVSIKVEVKNNDEYIFKTLNFKNGDDIFRKTKKNPKYQGLRITEISNEKNRVEISSGEFFTLGQDNNKDKTDIFRVQVRETIKNHLEKQQQLGKNIKVLSLFFIDKVDNYVYDDSLLRVIFEEEFNTLKGEYDYFRDKEASSVHNGYFSKQGKKFKDTKGNSKNDSSTYDLIMKDKERLLSFSEDTCFIFSHSALKEGWDNPNIFNICTLNETKSEMKKRQEIGRGMRLCVDTNGVRIYDNNINKLTVIPNESYQDYVANLQSEFKEIGQEAPTPDNQKRKVIVKFKKRFATNDENFKILWQKISKKTKYNVAINTNDLVDKIVNKINENLDIDRVAIKVERQQLIMQDNKVETIYKSESFAKDLDKKYPISRVVATIAKESGLTKRTVLDVLTKIDNLYLIFDNYAEFMRSLIIIFKSTLQDELLGGISYHEVNDFWQMEIFKDIETYDNKIIQSHKSVYDYSIYDSEGEREFAEKLDNSDSVKLFAKLPTWFKVETPIGDYNPDWAVVWQKDNKELLYLVRETKFVDDLQNLRPSEQNKIVCGTKHFEAIAVNFKVATKTNLEDLL